MPRHTPRALAAALVAMLAPALPAGALDPSRGITQYGLTTWQDGLPQQSVTAIAQTPDRYLWVGTQEGLARFDGERFEIFDRRRVPQLASNWVTSLLAQRDGTLWIATTDGVARRLPGGAFEKVTGDGFPQGRERFAEDANGKVWASNRAGLFAFRDGRMVRDESATAAGSGKGIRALASSPHGGLWWSDASGDLFHRGATGGLRKWTAGKELPVARATEIVVDGEDGCWVATIEGLLIRVWGEHSRVYGPEDGLPTARMAAATMDRQGVLWVGTYGAGLVRLARGKFDVLGPSGGFGDLDVTAVLADADGNLVGGTQAAGLWRLRDVPLETFGRPEGIADDNVRTLLAEADGSVLVGTTGPGLWRVLDGRVQAVHIPGPPFSSVSSLLRDRAGNLWIGSANRGLARWKKDGTVTWMGAGEGLTDTHVTALAEDRDGTLWVGTEGRGVRRVRNGRVLPPGPESALDRTWVTDIRQARDGAIWIATIESGAARLQDGKLTRWRREEGLPTEAVGAIHEDAAGDVWLGTIGGGLVRIHSGGVQKVTEAQGLFDDVILGLVEDRRGDLWLSSNRGVTRVSRRAVEAVMEGREPRLEPRVFARADGMRSAESNGGQQPSMVMDGAGRVWVATTKGAAVFDPGRDEVPPRPPAVLITAVEADGKPLLGVPLAPVPAGTRRVEIDFAAPDLTAPSQLRYQFRLEGWDPDWVSARERRSASYTGLPPGDYVFRVRTTYAGAAGEGPETTRKMTFEPTLTERPAFWAACVGLGVLALAAVYVVRNRNFRRRREALEALVAERTRTLEAEKERSAAARKAAEEASRAKSSFLASMSHEIRTPMNAVLGLTDLVLETPLEAEQRVHLDLVRSSGRHLLALLDEILDFSRIEAGGMQLASEPIRLRTVAADALATVRVSAELKGIAVRGEIAGDVPEWVRGDALRLRQVLINLLGNAVKFTATGSVTLAIARLAGDASRLEFRVVDTGPGIPVEAQTRIFEVFRQADEATTRRFGGTGLGLAISQRLVGLMGGTIEVESEPGKGSTFRFAISLPETTLPT